MRGTSIVSSSANADRDEERNVNPAGWPSRLRRRPHQRDVGLSLLESLERLLSRKNIALGGTVRGPSSERARIRSQRSIQTYANASRLRPYYYRSVSRRFS